MTEVLFAALVAKVIDFLRLLAHAKEQTSAIVTQLCAWTGGVLMAVVAAHAQLTQNVVIPGTDTALGKIDGWSQVLAGLLLASLGSIVMDVKQAIDNTDSAAKPKLLK